MESRFNRWSGAFALALAGFFSAAAQANLIVNGGFEDPAAPIGGTVHGRLLDHNAAIQEFV
ncbi:MAG: hypothetical protein PVG38_15370 [Gammaproteobacteria bacterium]|jgi:hypothetical protein